MKDRDNDRNDSNPHENKRASDIADIERRRRKKEVQNAICRVGHSNTTTVESDTKHGQSYFLLFPAIYNSSPAPSVRRAAGGKGRGKKKKERKRLEGVLRFNHYSLHMRYHYWLLIVSHRTNNSGIKKAPNGHSSQPAARPPARPGIKWPRVFRNSTPTAVVHCG